MKIDVKEFVERRKKKLKELEIKKTLLILQVGNEAASNAYIRGKKRDCEEVGFEVKHITFREGVYVEEVIKCIEELYDKVDGIILQEPANVIGDKMKILDAIGRDKDIDGFLPDSNFKPCTPLGIVNLLKDIRGTIGLKDEVIAVIGKGNLVGMPLVPMLMKKGATVIACNSSTPDLRAMTRQADIIVAATGVRNLLTRDMVKAGTIIIDAGIATDENGKLCGDCDKKMYDDDTIFITTVPGGVGLVTRVTLLENLAMTKDRGEIISVF